MISIKNSENSYGLIAILIHWLMAIIIIGLYFLGDYMVELGYYDNYYHQAPYIHKSIGLILFGLFLFRGFWKFKNITPSPVKTLKKYEIRISRFVHLSLYVLILICCVSGYLISTASDAGVDIFNWIQIPAILSKGTQQAEIAGWVHEISTNILIGFALLHALSGLKHHFINKDRTLVRMIKPNRSDS